MRLAEQKGPTLSFEMPTAMAENPSIDAAAP
jgi:hypothetical protein